jgi:NAD(P)-dependent dehydrogenase (short-subunit alcohol dehydrogenase family)
MAATAPTGHEKTAIVIGASRGLGLGLAREFAHRGWRVIATARNPSKAPELGEAAGRSDGRISVEEADIDSSDSVNSLVAHLADTRLDLVFISAGVSGPKHQSVDSVTAEELGALMFTNAVAPIRVARKLLPRVADGGTVAFMSSIMGSVADNTSGGMDLYRASKAALNALTRSFAANDVGKRPIAVLTMHPGWVRTAMGGEAAPLSVEESVRGLAEVIERDRGPGHRFVDYQGHTIPW